MIDPNLRSTLLKIQALTESNIDGESKSAQSALQRLLSKHGLTVDDLKDAIPARFFKFGYWNNVQRDLLFNICTKVMRTNEIEVIKLPGNASEIRMTPEQYAVIDTSYNYYCKVYDREVAIFNDAFMEKHSLFNPEGEEVAVSEEHYKKMSGIKELLDTVAVPGTTLGRKERTAVRS